MNSPELEPSYPIPPISMVTKWRSQWAKLPYHPESTLSDYIATCAARWGYQMALENLFFPEG